ncbi:hypothetical protein [Campylobacter geochelonis]|uniref:hypothetical protein n=1 Tax=Campylobacter geochelonis TaxID=1780362 RepID=UPI00155DC4A4|nr:hypothetical protein [Campylobacter geochelonis]QKF71145.1 putative membrane protein [Campylobacter geochelonis]
MNLSKEEFETLQKEYDELKDKNDVSISFFNYCFLHIVFSLAVFIIPTNILTIFPFLKCFTSFMSQYFPNIEIYANANKMPELVEFYFSYLWVVCIILSVWYIYKMASIARGVKAYFGVGEFSNKRIFNEKFIPVLDKQYGNSKGLLMVLLNILFFGFGLYLDFSGNILDSMLGRWMFDRFGIFLMGAYQIIVVFGLFVMPYYIAIMSINYNKFKNKLKFNTKE